MRHPLKTCRNGSTHQLHHLGEGQSWANLIATWLIHFTLYTYMSFKQCAMATNFRPQAFFYRMCFLNRCSVSESLTFLPTITFHLSRQEADLSTLYEPPYNRTSNKCSSADFYKLSLSVGQRRKGWSWNLFLLWSQKCSCLFIRAASTLRNKQENNVPQWAYVCLRQERNHSGIFSCFPHMSHTVITCIPLTNCSR